MWNETRSIGLSSVNIGTSSSTIGGGSSSFLALTKSSCALRRSAARHGCRPLWLNCCSPTAHQAQWWHRQDAGPLVPFRRRSGPGRVRPASSGSRSTSVHRSAHASPCRQPVGLPAWLPLAAARGGFKTMWHAHLHLLSALGGIRTPNLLIRSQMLYPLSYERRNGPSLRNALSGDPLGRGVGNLSAPIGAFNFPTRGRGRGGRVEPPGS